ncbi:hypothetical protein M0804_008509 [Polistes exclamans]|nr:hypothetical protein M0804_008509 [Polistes exclamans]
MEGRKEGWWCGSGSGDDGGGGGGSSVLQPLPQNAPRNTRYATPQRTRSDGNGNGNGNGGGGGGGGDADGVGREPRESGWRGLRGQRSSQGFIDSSAWPRNCAARRLIQGSTTTTTTTTSTNPRR